MKVRFTGRGDRAGTVNGVRVPYAPAKRRPKRLRWYVLLLVVASPLLYVLFGTVRGALVVTAPAYVSLENVAVFAPSAGIVATIRVRPGTRVRAGDVLVDLRNPELDARRATVEAQMRLLASAATPAPPPIAEAPPAPARTRGNALLEARARLAHENLATYENLMARGAATVADIANARTQLFAAESDLARDRADAAPPQPAPARAVATSESLAMRSQIATLRGELVGIRAQLAALRARAPSSGFVASIDVNAGEAVAAGGAVAIVSSERPPAVVAYLDPKDAEFATRGHRAWVTFPTGERLRAHVDRVSQHARRVPTSFVSPLATRPDSLELTLTFDGNVARELRAVDGLPVNVSFEGFRL